MNTPKRKSLKNKEPLTREEELLLENERLRCENAFLKKYNALIQAKEENLQKTTAQAIEELRRDFDLNLLLDCSKMALSSFYYH